MPSTGLLTPDDLDELGCTAFDRDQPLEVAAELVDAVDQGRVADEADAGYALMLAAEITEHAGDLSAAQVLAERAVQAYRVVGDPDGCPRAFHAELLLRLGREDEAMAELRALRPLLVEDPDAVSYISDALEVGGHAEVAEQWLTTALRIALHFVNHSRQEPAPRRMDPDEERATAVVLMLAMHRHRLRRGLDLPHDELDDLAEQLMDVVGDALDDDELDDESAALLFWPQPEFDRLLLRWPALAENYGQTWDEYRATLQRTLVLGSESGVPRLGLLAGSVDGLATYADRHGGDPTDSQVRQDYAQHLTEHPREIAWPPGRNEACWCGSSLKYKKCCLRRPRT
jgi:hypothetical protein